MPADTSCSLPKTLPTMLGRTVRRTISIVSRSMKITPRVKPMNGEITIGLISLGQSPTALPAAIASSYFGLISSRHVSAPRHPSSMI